MIKKGGVFYRLLVIFFCAILIAFAFNRFLIPNQIISGGVSGIAMILSKVTPIHNPGIIMLGLNLPILITGYLKLGKKFILYSVFAVLVITGAMQMIPVKPITSELLLASVFGGALGGIAGGLIFRFRASTGGFDLIGLLLTRKRDIPVGGMIFAMNALVVFFSGFLFGWDLALYTMISIYTSGRVVDTIHTRHIKLTLMIVSAEAELIKNRLLQELQRGITVLDGDGGYTEKKRQVLLTVISRYELSEVKELVLEVDPKAFVNITQTVEVIGQFR